MAKKLDHLELIYKVKYKSVLRKVCDNAYLTQADFSAWDSPEIGDNPKLVH